MRLLELIDHQFIVLLVLLLLILVDANSFFLQDERPAGQAPRPGGFGSAPAPVAGT